MLVQGDAAGATWANVALSVESMTRALRGSLLADKLCA
jgi:hypothetical protein